jgi:putative phosphoesterase
MRLGLISDTHGLLRGEVFDVFAGVDHILHAGDIEDEDILDALATIAPVTAVWGNVDGWDVRGRVPEVAEVELDGVRAVVFHGMQLGSPTPEKAAAAYPHAGLVVFGHSHRPVIQQVGSVLAVNPGSAGPRRFRDPVTVALAEIEGGRVSATLVELEGSRQ